MPFVIAAVIGLIAALFGGPPEKIMPVVFVLWLVFEWVSRIFEDA